jgi:hypothetical protein
MPGYEVHGFIGLSSPNNWLSTDALHCRVMGISDVGLLHIKHIPISGFQPCEHDYSLSADIIASSHQPVIGDSVLVHYRVNGGPYHTTLLANTTGSHYQGVIPKQPAGSVIKYFLTAADQSGRHASAPFIGAADPYTFETVYTNLAPVPDTLWFITQDECVKGKITQLHNFLSQAVNISLVQQNGNALPWYVDSMSVMTLPHAVNPADIFAIRVKMPLLTSLNPAILYAVDSMRVTTSAGVFHVIIMVNTDLLASVENHLPSAEIRSIYPNPFTSETFIPVEIHERGAVMLEILDISGTRVKRLASRVFEPGLTTIAWNGTGEDGNKLPDGIYLCRMICGSSTSIKRIALIH